MEGIRISEEYLEIDENGNEKNVGKEYALSNSKAVKKTQQQKSNSSTEWHESDPETYKSGLITYMQQIIAVYTPHYNGNKTTPGRYVFFGISQWLNDPINRKKDCVTLSNNVFTWSNKSTGDYLGVLSYDINTYMNGQLVSSSSEVTEMSYENLTVLTTTGAYFVVDLPFSSSIVFQDTAVKCSNIGFMFMGVANTTNKPEMLMK